MPELENKEHHPRSPRQLTFEPTVFGNHCLIDRISKGGMSDIFLAKPVHAGEFAKPVVVKKLLTEYCAKPRFVKRFINEASTLCRLNHSNIVQIMDMGVVGSEYYIALEYIEGRNIAYLINKSRKHDKRISLAFVVHIIMEVAKALAYAHKKKGVHGENLLLVHQDVNSFNVMVSYEAEVKLIDFGIARIFLDKSSKEDLPVAGKLLYFSPEQLQKKPVDRRVDIYGTGVLLYELLTGERPVQHQETVNATVRKILEFDIEKGVEGHPNIPEQLRPILIKCMAQDPSRRYPWMDDLLDDMREIVKSLNLDLNTTVFSGYMKDVFDREILLDRRRMRRLLSGEPHKAVKLKHIAEQKKELEAKDVGKSLLEELALICSEPSIAEATDRKRQSTCRTLEFQAGQTIFSQGEFAGDVYVVKKGAVRTFLKTGTIKQNLSVLGPGDFFGETCLVDDSNELISAEAIEASDIIAVPKDIFAGFFHDPLAPGISMALIKRIRDANALLESALIEDHLIRLIYGLLFLQRSKFNGQEMNFTELLESFRLPVSERLLKYVEKLESLQVVKTTDQTIQVKDTDKLESILNLLMKSGKFSLKF